jgi:Fur family zinc uptake transcriptional regulator
MQDAPSAFPPATHNHDDCVATAITTAENLCRERGLRFTALRQRVLTLVWNSHKPVGAYDILEMLSEEGKRAAPPTVYRALDFLIEAGLVHRLASLNAFIGCPDPARSHAGQFLICNRCRGVAELDDAELEELVGGKAAQQGFKALHQVLEIEGVCSACQAQG